MATSIPPRGVLTDQLLDYLDGLSALNYLAIGDGAVNPAAGWSGTPGQGIFMPSLTVRTGVAVPTARDELRSRHSSWSCSYSLKFVGALRQQADDAADQVRSAVLDFALTAGALSTAWSLQDVLFSQLGPVNKVGNDDSATFEIEDSVQLWLSRQRS